MKYPSRRIVLASFVYLLVAVVGWVRLAGPVRAGAEDVSGVVTGVNQGTLPATLTLDSTSGAFEVTVTEETVFTTAGEPDNTIATDANLLLGRFVRVTYDGGTGTASAVDVSLMFVNFVEVTRTSGSVGDGKVTVDTGFGGSLTLNVTDASGVTVDSEPVQSLGELRGVTALAVYDPTSLVALQIQGGGGVRRMKGRLVEVEPDPGAITVKSGGKNVTLFADSFGFGDELPGNITRDGQQVRLEDLQPGLDVIVDYGQDFDGRFAVFIQAATPNPATETGTVGEPSLTTQTLSVGGAAQVLTITPDTRIELKNKRVPLAQLPPGSQFKAKVVRRNGKNFVRTLTVRR